jgi:hypothetical protein
LVGNIISIRGDSDYFELEVRTVTTGPGPGTARINSGYRGSHPGDGLPFIMAAAAAARLRRIFAGIFAGARLRRIFAGGIRRRRRARRQRFLRMPPPRGGGGAFLWQPEWHHPTPSVLNSKSQLTCL